MAAAMPEGNAVFPRSHVGFDSITQQIEKKLLKRGFQFNVICVGGFTLLTSLFCFSTNGAQLQVKLDLGNLLSSIRYSHHTLSTRKVVSGPTKK
jgi:septin family protein